MQPLRMCVFLAFIAVLRCYEMSKNLAEFYCVFNGNFSDREQVKKDGASRTPIDERFQPIFAPALSKVPVIYFEKTTDGILRRAVIVVVTREEGDVIYLKQYILTGNFDIKPGPYDANTIKSFTANDFRGQQDCQHSFEHVEPFVFFVDWPICKESTQQGQWKSYAATFTCNGYLAVVPAGTLEKPTSVPYKMQRQGHRYPLENAPDNYDCNCVNTRDNTSD